MRKAALALGLSVALAPSLAKALEVQSDWGFITTITTGYVVDSMAVTTTAPLANPGCPVTTAGYATNPGDSGHQLHQAVLMMAFAMNKQVSIRASGCFASKPRIISVFLR